MELGVASLEIRESPQVHVFPSGCKSLKADGDSWQSICIKKDFKRNPGEGKCALISRDEISLFSVTTCLRVNGAFLQKPKDTNYVGRPIRF